MSLTAGDIGSKTILPDGVQVDHISENTVGHGSRVKGISDPTTYPVLAGDVGEEVIGYCTSTTTTTLADTEIDVIGATITLTPGVWDLSYSVTMGLYRPSGTATIDARLRVTDSSNVYEAGTASLARVVNSTSMLIDNYVQMGINKTIRVTGSSKVLKLRVTCSLATASGQATVIAHDSNVVGGITGNDSTSYIRAIRIA